MATVVCTLPNASGLINDIAFRPDRGQMIAEDVPDDAAAHFALIPGFKVVNAKRSPALAGDAGATEPASK